MAIVVISWGDDARFAETTLTNELPGSFSLRIAFLRASPGGSLISPPSSEGRYGW